MLFEPFSKEWQGRELEELSAEEIGKEDILSV
jgi:hypothetical protein